jgi:hypothetical protein
LQHRASIQYRDARAAKPQACAKRAQRAGLDAVESMAPHDQAARPHWVSRFRFGCGEEFPALAPQIGAHLRRDGSRDRSREILGRYCDRITLLEQHNRGPSAARDLTIAHFGGEYRLSRC